MEVLKVNAVGYYYYNPRVELKNYNEEKNNSSNKDINCTICLKSIYDPSYETISNNHNILYETKVELGKCGHLFHSDCIKRWLKTNQICPIDKVTWCRHRILDNKQKYCFNKKYFNNKKFQDKKEINKPHTEIVKKEIKEIIEEEIFEDQEIMEEDFFSDIEE
jgi:hypothetical protein